VKHASASSRPASRLNVLARVAALVLAAASAIPSATAAETARKPPEEQKGPAFGLDRSPISLLHRYLPPAASPADPKLPEYLSPKERAAALCNAGRYRQAIYALADQPASDELVALTLARAYAALGQSARALELLSNPALADKPAITLEHARLLFSLGQTADAIHLLQPLVTQSPDLLPARVLLGQLHESRGDLEAARRTYAPFEALLTAYRNNPDKFTSANDLVALGQGADRWATLSSAYASNTDLHETILGIFVRAYDVVDRTNLTAHLAAAEYLLRHDDAEQAQDELAGVLKANPHDADALLLIGRTALDSFNFDLADQVIALVRETDPGSLRSDLLLARSLIVQRRQDSAEPLLASVLKRDPENLEALGLLASIYALRVDEPHVTATLARADAIAPHSAVAHFELAMQLSRMRQYPRSADIFALVRQRAPWWSVPLNELALLYTQWGQEDQALQVLREARTLDPYNVRTTNYLRLLENSASMAVSKGPHFEVRYDPATDPLLGPLMLEYCESVHADLCKLFAHEPAETTLIEVFPTHAQFSVRTVGTPWIGTVGASTGRIIALVAPRDLVRPGSEGTLGAYNWAQVIRHEYTHTITLSATENRIPHWMTEGLAVWAEQTPLRWEWVPMLYDAVTRTANGEPDGLFTMDKLTWGFVRPRRPIDRQLAYAQSFWMCRYLVETYGRDSMLQILARFKAGRTQDQAFPDVLHKTTGQFYAEFVEWAKGQIATWGYDKISSATYDALREQGEKQIEDKDYPAALKTWQQIAQLRPVDALPHQRLAGLYLTPAINDKPAAREQLKLLAAVEIKDNRYAKRIVRLSLELHDLPTALDHARQAVYTNPYDSDAHELLLSIAEKQGDTTLIQLQKQRLQQLQTLKASLQKPKDKKEAPVEPG
jgi:Flp pilus assembly protein TadD